MKRITALILLMIYSVTSTGVTMHNHYCMGEMASTSFWQVEDKKCGKCGMIKEGNEDNGCCTDEQQWIKIEDDQKTNTAPTEILNLQYEVISFIIIKNYLFVSQSKPLIAESRALFRSCALPTYLLNCVFRI